MAAAAAGAARRDFIELHARPGRFVMSYYFFLATLLQLHSSSGKFAPMNNVVGEDQMLFALSSPELV